MILRAITSTELLLTVLSMILFATLVVGLVEITLYYLSWPEGTRSILYRYCIENVDLSVLLAGLQQCGLLYLWSICRIIFIGF